MNELGRAEDIRPTVACVLTKNCREQTKGDVVYLEKQEFLSCFWIGIGRRVDIIHMCGWMGLIF